MKQAILIGAVIVSTMPPVGVMSPNPDLTVQEICTPGYSKKARPPTDYTQPIKRDSCAALDADPVAVGECMKTHELDHYFPIEAGGCPDCPDNLWLQEWPEAKKKDVVENYVHSLLCNGQIDLTQVPDYISQWQDIYTRIKPDE